MAHPQPVGRSPNIGEAGVPPSWARRESETRAAGAAEGTSASGELVPPAAFTEIKTGLHFGRPESPRRRVR